MAFINKKTDGIPKTNGKHKKAVHVKRGYYTFSKYYPAGDTNRVYRKSISKARREKKMRTAIIVFLALAAVAALAVLILYL